MRMKPCRNADTCNRECSHRREHDNHEGCDECIGDCPACEPVENKQTTRMSLREQVARGISKNSIFAWEEFDESTKEIYLKQAAVAIAAMCCYASEHGWGKRVDGQFLPLTLADFEIKLVIKDK